MGKLGTDSKQIILSTSLALYAVFWRCCACVMLGMLLRGHDVANDSKRLKKELVTSDPATFVACLKAQEVLATAGFALRTWDAVITSLNLASVAGTACHSRVCSAHVGCCHHLPEPSFSRRQCLPQPGLLCPRGVLHHLPEPSAWGAPCSRCLRSVLPGPFQSCVWRSGRERMPWKSKSCWARVACTKCNEPLLFRCRHTPGCAKLTDLRRLVPGNIPSPTGAGTVGQKPHGHGPRKR